MILELMVVIVAFYWSITSLDFAVKMELLQSYFLYPFSYRIFKIFGC